MNKSSTRPIIVKLLNTEHQVKNHENNETNDALLIV